MKPSMFRQAARRLSVVLRDVLHHSFGMALLGLLTCRVALPQEHHVYLPLMFQSDAAELPSGSVPRDVWLSQFIRTTACLQVDEKRHRDNIWWERQKYDANTPERGFQLLISALRSKDKTALRRISDQKDAEDQRISVNGKRGLEGTAEVIFQQFDSLELLSVPALYEFDDLAVFVAKVRDGKNTSFLPFAFAHEPDDSFGFLPNRSGNKITYDLVQDWLVVNWKIVLAADTRAAYCAGENVKPETHAIQLIPVSGHKVWRPSELFLSGVFFDHPDGHAAIIAQISSTIKKMQAAIASGSTNELVEHMTPAGGRRLKQALASSDKTGRRRLEAAITERKPFFLFDASPLLVVIFRGKLSYDGIGEPNADIQTMYFTPDSKGRWLWTNAASITDVDKIFRQGPLVKGCSSRQTFQ